MTAPKPKVGPNTPKNKGNAGKGRPKGAQNKATKALKEMILGALEDAGGQDYLRRQAMKNPAAFLTLIGKVLPQTLNATLDATPEALLVTRRQDG